MNGAIFHLGATKTLQEKKAHRDYVIRRVPVQPPTVKNKVENMMGFEFMLISCIICMYHMLHVHHDLFAKCASIALCCILL